jgi:hypothetical protein
MNHTRAVGVESTAGSAHEPAEDGGLLSSSPVKRPRLTEGQQPAGEASRMTEQLVRQAARALHERGEVRLGRPHAARLNRWRAQRWPTSSAPEECPVLRRAVELLLPVIQEQVKSAQRAHGKLGALQREVNSLNQKLMTRVSSVWRSTCTRGYPDGRRATAVRAACVSGRRGGGEEVARGKERPRGQAEAA